MSRLKIVIVGLLYLSKFICIKYLTKTNINSILVKENDEFIFLYTSENIKDFFSLIMPVRQKPYIHNKLHPIFEMHLPEGYLLFIIKKHFSKLTKIDDYIVKSWGEDYQELALNEYYCMKIVNLSNIDVPEFFISDDEKLFIMK